MIEDLKDFFRTNGLMLIKACIWAGFAILLTMSLPDLFVTGDKIADVMFTLYIILFVGVLCSFAINMFKLFKYKNTKGKNKK